MNLQTRTVCSVSCWLLPAMLMTAGTARGQSAAPPAAAPDTIRSFSSELDLYDTAYAPTPPTQRLAAPLLVLTQPMDNQARRDLTEDLQVLDALLTRAIGGESTSSQPFTRVLGVMVNSRGNDEHIQYIQNVAVTFQYDVSISVAKETAATAKDRPAEQPESEWDAARRSLFAANLPAGANGPYRAAAVTYNQELVETLSLRIANALKNVGRIRDFQKVLSTPSDAQPQVIVVLRGSRDHSVMTFTTTPSRAEFGPEGVKRHQYFLQRNDNWHTQSVAPAFFGVAPRFNDPLLPVAPPQPVQPAAPALTPGSTAPIPQPESLQPPTFPRASPVPVPDVNEPGSPATPASAPARPSR